MAHSIRNERGVTLVVVLVVVAVLGLSLGMAGSTWRTVMQREKEEELLFRGNQYREAIRSYYHGAAGAQGVYPTSLEDLLRDPRPPRTVRHIRKLYKDPMTGGDWLLIRQGGTVGGTVTTSGRIGGIIGVRSASDLEPFKKDRFSEENETFKDKEKYSEWQFVYQPE